MRTRYIHPEHDQRNPLYSDVHFGSGGIAGGKFTHGATDTLTDTSYDALIDSDGSFILQTTDGSKILLNA